LKGIAIISMIVALLSVVVGVTQSITNVPIIPGKTTASALSIYMATEGPATAKSNTTASPSPPSLAVPSGTTNGNKDSDDDGLSDDQEINNYRTDPLNNDTDGDGLPDGKEVNGWAWAVEEKRGCTSTNVCHMHKTNPLNPDTDNDGNDDYYEYTNYPSDPTNPDQDNDGLLDGLESGPHAIYYTSYLLADTDHDGFSDGLEVKLATDPRDPSSHPPLTPTPNTNDHLPIADPLMVSTNRGQPIDITLRGRDPDGDQIFFFIVIRPLHGSLSRIDYTGSTSAKVIYVPASNYVGPDSFKFIIYDGKAYGISPVIVSIAIHQ
jgi:hypothetical protein